MGGSTDPKGGSANSMGGSATTLGGSADPASGSADATCGSVDPMRGSATLSATTDTSANPIGGSDNPIRGSVGPSGGHCRPRRDLCGASLWHNSAAAAASPLRLERGASWMHRRMVHPECRAKSPLADPEPGKTLGLPDAQAVATASGGARTRPKLIAARRIVHIDVERGAGPHRASRCRRRHGRTRASLNRPGQGHRQARLRVLLRHGCDCEVAVNRQIPSLLKD